MSLRTLAFVLVALGTALAAAGPAAATTMHRFTERELAYVADSIVVGRVESVGSALSGRGDQPYTYVRLRVDRALKGPARTGTTVTVREMGGETPDGRVAFVPASPQFAPGERVLLFLEAGGEAGTWRCVGLFQGKYTLRSDGGREVAFTVHTNRYVPDFDPRAVPTPSAAVEADGLLARVRGWVDGGDVPPYVEIPGLPASRRATFRAYWGLAPEEARP